MNESRTYGLDIYRIAAMIMITVLHVVNQHLGMLDTTLAPVVFCSGYILEYSCFAGVNCFALLSGYLLSGDSSGYDKKWLKRIAGLWCKLILWGLLLSLLSCPISGFKEIFTWGHIETTLFPAVSYWWYISAYFGLLLFLPLVNKGIAQCSNRDLLILSVAMFIVFSVLICYMNIESALMLYQGYSTIWLLICYIYGAALKRFMPMIIKWHHVNVVNGIILGISILFPLIYLQAGTRSGWSVPWRFMNYISPFCVLEAAALLVFCVQIKLQKRRMQQIVSFVSRNALGIYLFQTFPVIWNRFIYERNPVPASGNSWIWYLPSMILILLGCGVACNVIVDKIYCAVKKFMPRDNKN